MNDLLTVLPPIVLGLGGVILLLVDLAVPRERKTLTAILAAVVASAAGVSAVALWGARGTGFSGMVSIDGVALFLDGLFAVIGLLTIAISVRYNTARGIMRGEFYALILFALSGMSLMGHAANLLTVFMAIELLSIPLYVLCGIARPRQDSEESAMKYFLLGAFASGFLVFGIALTYGATGQLSLDGIARAAAGGAADSQLLLAGAALMLVGLGFKIAAAPFHMWTPDVYEGAPTSVTAFMATATKAAGFAAIVRVFTLGLAPIATSWQPVFAVLSALTMLVGNLAALTQTNLKRMLAYSSIAHAGYLLMGLAAGGPEGVQAVLFYLAAYGVTTLAAFAAMTAARDSVEDQTIESYAGFAKRKSGWAIVMAVAMLSMIGIPPTAGFAGKYFLFQSAISVGLIPLAIIGVLTSVIGAYYYLRVIVVMFFRDSPNEAEGKPMRASVHNLAGGLAVVATVVIGILPTPILGLVAQGVRSLVR
jgi:NADH-quinone oxidoreductase subunit N